jgi:hypothetical protein
MASRNADGKPEGLGLNLWLIIISVVVVIIAAFFGWSGLWKGRVPADAVKAGEVASKGISYYGKEIKIHGYVSKTLTGRLFEISDAITGTASLPVIVRGAGIVVTSGDSVIVEGVPTAFDSGKIRQVYGIELPEEATVGWTNCPVVIAGKVRKLK